VYDGATTAAVTAGTLSDVVGTDAVTVSAEANYDNADPGTGKAITVVYTLGGTDAANYITPVNDVANDGAITTTRLTITGPTSLLLTEGYAATSTTPYTASGLPAPTISKTGGHPSITWNSASQTLDIAAGITAGSYPVVLTATNGTGTDATITFTLTVVAPISSPIPIFFNLGDTYNVNSNIPLMVTGQGSHLLTTFTVTITVNNASVPVIPGAPPHFTPTQQGTYLIEASSADGNLKIWKHVIIL
jgi:hypothetical protein